MLLFSWKMYNSKINSVWHVHLKLFFSIVLLFPRWIVQVRSKKVCSNHSVLFYSSFIILVVDLWLVIHMFLPSCLLKCLNILVYTCNYCNIFYAANFLYIYIHIVCYFLLPYSFVPLQYNHSIASAFINLEYLVSCWYSRYIMSTVSECNVLETCLWRN